MASTQCVAMVLRAQQLRLAFPERFGRKGSKAGDVGHIKHGWQKAVRKASQEQKRLKNTRPPKILRIIPRRKEIALGLGNIFPVPATPPNMATGFEQTESDSGWISESHSSQNE